MEKLTDTYTLQGGVQIPCVGFGTWQVPDGETAVRSVVQAVEAGYRRHLRKRGGRWRSDPRLRRGARGAVYHNKALEHGTRL